MGLLDDPEVSQIQNHISIEHCSPLVFKTRAFLMFLRNQSKHLGYRGKL